MTYGVLYYFIYAVGWLVINGPFGRHGPLSQLAWQCAQLKENAIRRVVERQV